MMSSYSRLSYSLFEGNDPHERPRVYFFCHEEDYEKTAYDVKSDIFGAVPEAAIWTFESGEVPSFSDDEKENFFADLMWAQVIVFSVTGKFLHKDNFARCEIFPFAVKNHIPVLPILFEGGLERDFNSICGDYQCLYKFSTDSTEIPYAEKVKNFLDSVILPDDLTKRIKECFRAYIFLSYRKKDRKFVNDVMKLLHKEDGSLDVAVWYDEFLRPGEDFNASIKAAFDNSSIFSMLVTPSLLEDPNYVMTTEYPMAREKNVKILPIEAAETDKGILQEKYRDIPKTYDITAEEVSKTINSEIENSISKKGTSVTDMSGERLFLLGNAYLFGIDVEKDFDKAVSLLEMSSQKDYIESYRLLSDVFERGISTSIDYVKAYNYFAHYANKKFYEYQDAIDVSDEYDDEIARTEIRLYNLAIEAGAADLIVERADFFTNKVAEKCKESDYNNEKSLWLLILMNECMVRILDCLGNEAAADLADALLEDIEIYKEKFSEKDISDYSIKADYLGAITYGKLRYFRFSKELADRAMRVSLEMYNKKGESHYLLQYFDSAILYYNLFSESYTDLVTVFGNMISVHRNLVDEYKEYRDVRFLERIVNNGTNMVRTYVNTDVDYEYDLVEITKEIYFLIKEYMGKTNSERSRYFMVKFENSMALRCIICEDYENAVPLMDYSFELLSKIDSVKIYRDYALENVRALFNKALFELNNDNLEMADLYAKQALSLFEECSALNIGADSTDFITVYADLCIIRASACIRRGHFSEGIEALRFILEYKREDRKIQAYDTLVSFATGYFYAGIAYSRLDDWDSADYNMQIALFFCTSALKAYESEEAKALLNNITDWQNEK